VIGIAAAIATDPVIAANTFIYLNTDQNTATGFTPFGSVGAEYYVQFSAGSNGVFQPYLYSLTSAGVPTQLNGGAPLNFGVSANGESVEVAIPQTLLTPSGGAAPKSINFAALINNGAAALPGDPLRSLLELRRIVARLVQQCYVCLDFAARQRKFARQRGTASAFLFKCAAMLLRARRQLLSRGGGVLQEGRRFIAFLSVQLCGIRGLRPQLQIEPVDSSPGLGKLIRQNL
jgi:hypothetical protein